MTGHTVYFHREIQIIIFNPAIAAMHSPRSVFDIGHCTVIHCDAGGVSLVYNEKQRKTDISLTGQIIRCFLKLIKVSVIIEH